MQYQSVLHIYVNATPSDCLSTALIVCNKDVSFYQTCACIQRVCPQQGDPIFQNVAGRQEGISDGLVYMSAVAGGLRSDKNFIQKRFPDYRGPEGCSDEAIRTL